MLDKRKAELGVAFTRKPIVGVQETDDSVKALLYDEGFIAQQQEKIFNKPQFPQIQLIDIDLEEPRDIQAVKACMKKYQRLWKNLFSKYANTGFTTKAANNFD